METELVSEADREFYRNAVAKGAALLDEKKPGWESRVLLSELDMGLCTECVLGQVFGNYMSAMPKIGLGIPSGGSEPSSGWDHGFNRLPSKKSMVFEMRCRASRAHYAVLAEAWDDLIRTRRGDVS